EPPATSEATPAPVKVLPPVRPRSLSESPAAEAPARTAALDTDAPASRADRKPAAEAGGNFAVQIAVRPTEEEARSAYSQLQDKFAADLDGKPARVTQGEVRGKTVHRVRVGPMSKADATALCNKLKGSGGSCFVANLN
ncbi:SPOR domain-containing protein, partial [Enterovirga sp.]|uniref:SPOR domain-containing protein n=1 Tax=Enterovirga sp. TaxID=2026350 RepID=UPI0026280B08